MTPSDVSFMTAYMGFLATKFAKSMNVTMAGLGSVAIHTATSRLLASGLSISRRLWITSEAAFWMWDVGPDESLSTSKGKDLMLSESVTRR